MTGQSFESISGPVVGRVEKLRDIQGAALFHIKGVGAFFTLFVLLQIGLYYLAARRLRTKPSGEMPWIQRFSLAFMAVPVGTLILAAVWSTEWNPATAALVLVAACSLITFAALKGPWARTPAGSPAFVCAFTVAVISLDLLTGAHLQLSSLIGYSPIVAGRFYGLGNLTFAVLAASSILLAAEAGVRLGRKGLFVAGAIGGAVVVLDGLPAFGADLGGIIAMVPAFGVLMIVLLGRKPSVRLLVGLVVLAGGVAFLAGYLDSLRPASSQTHLGRFVARLVEQGPGGVQEIVVRKAQANLSVLTQSVLTLSIPTAIFFLIILLRRPYGRLRAAMQTEAGLRAGLIATPVAMVIGFAVNDSGIAIPAMGLGMIVPYCLATIQGIRAPAEATQATK